MSGKVRGRILKKWIVETRDEGIVFVDDLIDFCDARNIDPVILRAYYHKAKPDKAAWYKGARIIGKVE